MRQKALFTSYISVWQHLQLFKQICPWDAHFACYWHVKRSRNDNLPPPLPPPPTHTSLPLSFFHSYKWFQCTGKSNTSPSSSALRARCARHSSQLWKHVRFKLVSNETLDTFAASFTWKAQRESCDISSPYSYSLPPPPFPLLVLCILITLSRFLCVRRPPCWPSG